MVRRRTQPGDGTFVGLVVEHDGEVVGDSMLHLQGTGLSEGEIGWTILPQHAGRGFATEAAQAVLRLAFEHYGLRRVVANLDARNQRSAALCERLGMRREVDRVADFWSKGTWTSSYEYALLRDEWQARGGPDPPHVRTSATTRPLARPHRPALESGHGPPHQQWHHARRRQRGRPAGHRHAPPSRQRAEAAHAPQQRPPALRRHPVGGPGAGGARRVRRDAAQPRRRGALPHRAAHRDPRERARPQPRDHQRAVGPAPRRHHAPLPRARRCASSRPPS